MSIRLTFSNPNNPDSVVVYRSETKIDLADLPTPLATLPGTATSFSDVTAVRNTVYYYVVGSYKGSDVLFTQNQMYGYFPDTGPGSSKLLRGNWKEGYFGTCTTAELFAAQELCTALAYTPAGAVNTSGALLWHKFILDGKILFTPDLSISQDSWYYLYQAGLVYGTDDTGARPTSPTGVGNITPRNQKRTVTKNNRTYLVRLPKASAAPTTEFLTDFTAADARWGEGEWNRTMGRLGLNNFTLCTRTRLGNKVGYATNNYLYTGALTQHFNNNTTAIIMFGAVVGSDLPSTLNWTNAYYAWRPVLELVL